MYERVKQYYEYLIAADPRFKKFVEDTEDLEYEDIVATYNLEDLTACP